jgi:hypothetical protein
MDFAYKSDQEGHTRILHVDTQYDFLGSREIVPMEKRLGAWIYYAEEYCAGRLRPELEPIAVEEWQEWLEKMKKLPYEPFNKEILNVYS